MRRLQVLPCPEAWERMREDGDGRFCDRCQLRVTEVARLDEAGLDELLARAGRGRACARFELDGGRPRLGLGLAAGLVVVALAGCAGPVAPASIVPFDRAAYEAFVGEQTSPDSGGRIAGVVRTPAGVPVAGALVVLQSSALEGVRERVTNERGLYKFEDLPPGEYTIQVLAGNANVSKITALPENARFMANFSVDPDAERPLALLGVLVEESMIDTTSASSTYSSRMIEYD